MLKEKLLFLCKYYPPEAGGIELTSEKLVEFSKGEFSVSTIAFKKRSSTTTSTKTSKFFTAIELFRQPISLRYFVKSVLWGLNTGILYVHYPNMLSAVAAIVVKILRPKKLLIVHYHADVMFSAIILKFLSQFITRNILRFSNGIVVTSQRYLEGSTPLNSFKHKVEIIPSSTSKMETNELTQTSKTKSVLFIGRLVPYKGILEFVQHIDEIDPTAIIHLVGEGPLRPKLIEIVDTLQTKQRVKLHGYVNNNDLNKFIRFANLVILPSITKAEAFGLVLLEAHSRGVPCVCFDIPGSGVTFVNKHKVTGYNVDLYDYAKFNSYINKILRDCPFNKDSIINYHSNNFSDSVIKGKWLKYVRNIS